MGCKEGQFYVVKMILNNQFKGFGIYLNTPHVNGKTPFDFRTFQKLSPIIFYFCPN